MTFRATEGAEPFPGYILVKRLGTGGFGEVWHAKAPGGLAKAIKIIYGNTSDSRAEQELRALSRIREVRHPFLLSLDRFETIDDQVVIVMELAEGSLLDRFVQCREGGQPGVPRTELLGHLRDAADALDYMNDHHDLQHLDIKPQNLLLVGGRIKVADFGLVKDLQGTSASATGGVTPIYAAPEAFDGRVTRSSDQYSLAIVYQEMLTGVRPFTGKSALQLAHQHINCAPVLDPLSPEDRTVMARALAKSPRDRFPTCRDMIDGLLHALEPEQGISSTKPSRPVRTPVRAKLHFRSSTPSSVLAKETVLERSPAVSLEQLGGPSAARTVAVRPTLFIGVGGLGGQAIRQLRRQLQLRFGDERRMPIFKVLHIDSDADSLLGTEGPMTADEVLHMPLYRPEHYRSHTADILQWLNRRWLYNIPHSLATEGMRPLGRLAFVDHLRDLLSRIDALIGDISSDKAGGEAERLSRFRVAAGGPRVIIVAGIGGGTGGGCVLDLGYAVRQVLESRQLATSGLCGVLLYPGQENAAETDLARINTYATLAELHHYLHPTGRYPGDPKRGLKPRTDGVGPFAQTYLLPLDEKSKAADSNAVEAAVEYIYANAATSAGEFFDRYRQETSATGSGAATVRTFGIHWLTIPRFDLAEGVAVMLARQLVHSWLEDDPALRPSIDLPLLSWGLDGDSLSQRVSKLASQYLGRDPEAVIQGIVENGLASSEPDGNLIQRVLSELDTLLGAGVTAQRYVAAGLEKGLHEAAHQLGCQTAFIVEKWLAERVNDLEGRLSIAADCTDGVLLHLQAVLHGADSLQETAQTNALELRNRLGIGDAFASSGGGGWRWKSTRRNEALDKQNVALLAYARHRLKQISFAAAGEVVRPVIATVRRFKDDLTVCRDKLLRLLTSFRTETGPARLTGGAHSLPLLPEGKTSVAAAASDLFVQIQAKLMDRLDQLLEDHVIAPLGGLWHVVMANSELGPVFGQRLLALSRELALADMIDMDAAKLFLRTFPEEDEAAKRLGAYLEAALPPLLEAGGREHLVAAIPPGEAGRTVAQMVGQAFVNVPTTTMPMESDVVLCWEVSQVPLRDATAWLLGDNEDAMDMARNILTRSDVQWLLPAT